MNAPDFLTFSIEADPPFWRRMAERARCKATTQLLARVPYWDRAAIEARRDRLLRRMVRHAYGTVPYYRQLLDAAGVRPEQIRALEDLSRLPVTPDSALRDDSAAFLSTRHRPEDCYPFKSSGSTGAKKLSYQDPIAVMRGRAYDARIRPAFGRILNNEKIHRPLGFYPRTSNCKRQQAVNLRLFSWRAPTDAPAVYVDSTAPFEEQLAVVNERQPDMITGFARTVGHFFAEARRHGAKVHVPRILCLGGEFLPAEERRIIEEDFGAPVIMVYACMEGGNLGFECECRRDCHIQEDIIPVRIVDAGGATVPDGQSGRVVLSNLLNPATVLINYAPGDEGAFHTEPCACGRRFRRLALSHARKAPLLRTPNGKFVNYLELFRSILDRPESRHLQLIVERPGWWRIGVNRGDPQTFDPWMEGEIQRMAGEFAGDGVRLTWQPLDRPELSEGGKVLPVILRAGEGDSCGRKQNAPSPL